MGQTWHPAAHLQGATPRETDTLDIAVQEHIAKCRQCQAGIKDNPRGFGQKTKMCPEYLNIVQMFADGKYLFGPAQH
jgi:hypothetical protein